MRRKTTITRTLPCKLTKDELMDRANRLASLFQAAKELDTRHKREKAKMKDEAEESDAAVAEMMKQVREKAEDRPVAVEVILDDEGGAVYFVRTDTGEVVEHRAMEDHERQLDMTDDEAQEAFVAAIERFRERKAVADKRAAEHAGDTGEDEDSEDAKPAKRGVAKTKKKAGAKKAETIDEPESPDVDADLP